jgi:regulator of protease activity HflC (stomatin/prohibitin superfamily)
MEFGTFAGICIFIAITIAFQAVKQVPQGYEFTVERFGKYTHTLKPGLSIIVPFIDRIGHEINIMEQVLSIPSQEVISRDNAMVKVDGVVFYQIINSAKASYEVNDLERAISNLTVTNIRTVLGSLDIDETLSQRDHINSKLLSVIDEATISWGVKVTRIEIKDITPPKDLVNAMAAQMKAEREKRARVLEAEGIRQAQILEAEGRKKSEVLAAEADKEAAYLEAEARERLAEAEAKATETVSKAIKEGEKDAINYFVAQKYVEALGKLASSQNQKTLIMPIEATNVLGSIAGITELLSKGKQ